MGVLATGPDGVETAFRALPQPSLGSAAPLSPNHFSPQGSACPASMKLQAPLMA